MSILLTDGKAFEAQLVPKVLAAVAEFEMPLHSVTLKDKSSLWKVSSALQKSIRRGFTDLAIKYTQAMFNGGQGEYFWRRISVIAMEDIGPADRMACAECLCMSRMSEYRKSNPMKIACWLSKRLAEAPKSRSYTDVISIASIRAKQLDELPSLELDTLKISPEILLPEPNDAHAWQSYLARRMMGDRELEKTLAIPPAPREPIRSEFWEMANTLLDPLSMYLLYTGQKKGVHDLNSAVIPLWHVLGPSYSVMTQKSVLPEPFFIGGVIEQAFDWHNQEGKRCLGYYGKAYHPLAELLQEVNDPLGTVGIILFQAESGLLDRIMRHPRLDSLLEEGDLFDYVEHGISPEKGKAIRELVSSDEGREVLRQVRLRVVSGHAALDSYVAEGHPKLI